MFWLLGFGIALVYYGFLGVSAGKRYAYVSDSYRGALKGAPAPIYRYTRAQNWLTFHYRKQLLGLGFVMLLACLVDVIMQL